MTKPSAASFAVLMLALSMVGFGLVPLFARRMTDAGLAPAAVSMFRYMLPALVFLPFLKLRGQAGRTTLWGFSSGLLVTFGWVGYVKSLTMIPVPVAGVLYMTYPLFTLAVGWAVFRDRPHPLSILAGAIILAAAALVSDFGGAGGRIAPEAVLLALAAPASFGLGINVLARKMVAIPMPSRIAAFSSGSTLGLLPVIATIPLARVIPPDLTGWLNVAGLTFLTAFLPQILYNTYVPKVGAAKSGAVGALELPTMFAVGWLFLGDAVGPREAVAGALVLAAILLTPAREPPVPDALPVPPSPGKLRPGARPGARPDARPEGTP
ncbi:MAG: DMT family transporter [Paracoccaceae bacterium]